MIYFVNNIAICTDIAIFILISQIYSKGGKDSRNKVTENFRNDSIGSCFYYSHVQDHSSRCKDPMGIVTR